MDKNQIDTSGRELGKYTKEDLLVPVEIAFNKFSIHDAYLADSLAGFLQSKLDIIRQGDRNKSMADNLADKFIQFRQEADLRVGTTKDKLASAILYVLEELEF